MRATPRPPAHADGSLRRLLLVAGVAGLAATALLTIASWAGASWEVQAGALLAGGPVLGIAALASAARQRRWLPADGPRWGERAMQLALLFCVLNLLALVLATHPRPTHDAGPPVGRMFLACSAYCYTFCVVWYWPRNVTTA